MNNQAKRSALDRVARGVDAALGLRLGDALHAVRSALPLEDAVGAVALDGKRHFLVAALLPWTEGYFLHLPAPVAGKLGVHAIKVAGENRRFVAPGPPPNFHDDAAILFPFDQEQIFQAIMARK